MTVHSPQGGELIMLAQRSLSKRTVGNTLGWQAVKWVTQWASFIPENLPHPPPVKGAGLQRAYNPHSHRGLSSPVWVWLHPLGT